MTLEIRNNRAFWHGARVNLTVSEFAVVSRLASVPGIDVTYLHLYEVVRGVGFIAGYGDGPEAGYRQNTRNFITRIRRKFKAIDPTFNAIKTYESFGYCWQEDFSLLSINPNQGV